MNLSKSPFANCKMNLSYFAIVIVIVGLLLVTLEVNGQRRRSRQRTSISIPSINTSNTTLRNSLCTSPFSKQRVVGQCKPLVSFYITFSWCPKKRYIPKKLACI